MDVMIHYKTQVPQETADGDKHHFHYVEELIDDTITRILS